jgi:hypothetical protein
MKKDSFEEAFQRLPWRSPPESLRHRIFAASETPRHSILPVIFDRRISLRWAAALVACAGILGYGAGRLHPATASASSLLGQVDLQIIESGTSKNFFDLSQEPQDLWPGSLNLSVQPNTEDSG